MSEHKRYKARIVKNVMAVGNLGRIKPLLIGEEGEIALPVLLNSFGTQHYAFEITYPNTNVEVLFIPTWAAEAIEES